MITGARFHFQSFWPKVEGFAEVVEEVWNSVPPNPNPFKGFNDKLRATTKLLASWSARFIGNVKLQILVANEVILLLDVAMESRQLSPEEHALRKLLKRKLLGPWTTFTASMATRR